ncbi:MAG: YggS family pyridoxal phosphate-dependent enzyme [Planctomycetota bacterium]
MQTTLDENLMRVRTRIERARAGARRPGLARLVGVTKRSRPQHAAALARRGVPDLGENRLEGLQEKREWFEAEAPDLHPRWHFIGHVQRNKARRVAELSHVIHSVDSLRLLETLERVCARDGLAPEVFLQLKLTDEDAKHGMQTAELDEALAAASECRAVRPAGLMGMAALANDDAGRRAAGEQFERLATLAQAPTSVGWVHGRPLLSMGMSADFELAVEAGSDWLRLGSILFEGVDAGGSDRADGAVREGDVR